MEAAFTFGKFNDPHIGHVELLRQALEGHERLYVGVSSAKKNKDLGERLKNIDLIIAKNGWRGRVCVFPGRDMMSAYDSLHEKCDVVLGEDRESVGARLAELNGASYIKVKRLTSSTEVRRRLAEGEDISDLVPNYLLP